MRKRKSILQLSILLCSTFVSLQVSACGNASSVNSANSASSTVDVSSELVMSDAQNKPSGEEMSHVQVERSTGPGKELLTFPLYYQQDYADVPFKDKTVAEYGSLITCLSMMESFYQADFITPDVFLENHSNAEESSDALLQDFADYNGRTLHTYDFDAELLGSFLVNERREVLLFIPHSSVFGDTGSYMILTGTTVDGRIYVRDPIQNNINNWGTFIGDEPTYDATVLCEQASSSSKMYVFTETPK